MARAAASVSGVEPRRLVLHNLHTAEKLDAVYWEEGRYVPDAVAAANKVLRDYRNKPSTPSTCVCSICCTRSMASSVQASRSRSSPAIDRRRPTPCCAGVRTRSPRAACICKAWPLERDRLEGVALDHLHRAALGERAGGVGLYPTSNFVHMDVGRVRQWSGS